MKWQILNFAPHYPDPVQEAIGISTTNLVAVLVVLIIIFIVVGLLFWFGKPIFTEEQEERIREIIVEEAKK